MHFNLSAFNYGYQFLNDVKVRQIFSYILFVDSLEIYIILLYESLKVSSFFIVSIKRY